LDDDDLLRGVLVHPDPAKWEEKRKKKKKKKDARRGASISSHFNSKARPPAFAPTQTNDASKPTRLTY